jgi:hypothetical protein
MSVLRLAPASLALLITAGSGEFLANAASDVGTAPVVPENLKVPATQMLSLETHATGVQIYECSASKTDPTRFEWVFKAPEADLFDSEGKKVGKHYAGPTWESNDGSKMVGEVKARDKAPAEGCDREKSGKEARIDYRARYYFFAARP